MTDTLFYAMRRVTRVAHKIPGLGRLCELARKWAGTNGPVSPLLIDDFRGAARFWCFVREHMGGQIFFRGSYSGVEISCLEKILRARSVFLDVGANHGEFSIAAALCVPDGRVVAFEPVSEYRQRLANNIEANGFKNIELIPCALGEREADLPIYDSDDLFGDGTRNEGLTSLFASPTRAQVRESVTVRRLDNVLEDLGILHVDVIKLDIEGGEWSALRGATNTLSRSRPILIVEVGRRTCRSAGYEPEAFVEWLLRLNYSLEIITGNGQLKPLVEGALGDFQNILARPL